MGKFYDSKWFTNLVAVFLLALIVFLGYGFTAQTKTRISRIGGGAGVTLNNSSVESDIFDVRNDVGIFSIHYAFAATSHSAANVDIDVWMSPDGTTGWCRSSDAYSVAVDLSETSGTDSNGIDCIKVEPTVNGFYKFKFTETETQNAIFSAWIIRR